MSQSPKKMGNRGTRFLRKVLKVRKVGMKSLIFYLISAFRVELYKIIQGNMTKSALKLIYLTYSALKLIYLTYL